MTVLTVAALVAGVAAVAVLAVAVVLVVRHRPGRRRGRYSVNRPRHRRDTQ